LLVKIWFSYILKLVGEQNREITISMGSTNEKADDVSSSRETNIIECIPVCLGCSPICEPQNVGTEPEYAKNKWTKSGSFRAGSFRETNAGSKAAEINLDQRTPESVGSLQSTHLPTSSNQPLQRSRSGDVLAPVQRPVIQSSLSFKGKIPPDWDQKQQEQLQWAITEVSRRLKIRAPGARATQGQMAARSRELQGDHVTGDYNKK
jgi:hypothetical protein